MPQSYTYLLTHIVFSTKDRTASILPDMADELYAYMVGIVHESHGRALIVNGTADHVHMLVQLPPTLAVADAVREVKSNSSRWVHRKWPQHASFGWQAGYGAFSVSLSVTDDIVRYIAQQEEHHRKHTFQEEFVVLLKRHGVQYDERYLWA